MSLRGDGSINLPQPQDYDCSHGISKIGNVHVTPAHGGVLPGRGLQACDRENPIGKVEQTMGGHWFHESHAWRLCPYCQVVELLPGIPA